jgi:hypothetical protein
VRRRLNRNVAKGAKQGAKGITLEEMPRQSLRSFGTGSPQMAPLAQDFALLAP